VTTELAAAIDCGTNSTRLLIAGPDGDVVRRAVVTGLGRDLGPGGLHPASVERTLAVLAEFRTELDRHDVSRRRAVATAAARDAPDGAAFVEEAAEVLGVTPRLLTGDEEGQLAFAGAVADLPPAADPYLLVDIGGRSTELVLGAERAEEWVSLPMGSVRYTAEFLRSDPPAPEELSALLSLVGLHLDDVRREHPDMSGDTALVGVAGTITTVAAVEIGLSVYDPEVVHHFVLTRAAVEDVFRTLATEPLADRVHNPGLPRDRADVIVAGCAVLVGIMRYFGHDRLVVSEHDLLDGVLAADQWPS
jgi:exopolyphosphatase/guanosine-5'-triphosphate,3'-diphosphate pyrophosphatase